MADLRLDYLDKVKALNIATVAVEDIVNNIRTLGSLIDDYDTVLLPDEDEPFTPRAFGARGVKVLAKDWPNFEQFADALATWRIARREAESASVRVAQAGLAEGLEALPLRPSQETRRR